MKQITIAGTIGRDAETRQAGQNNVTGWSVAVDHREGQNKSTMWFDCSMWGKRGEVLKQYLTKGSKITVTGDLSIREHDGKTYLKVNVDNVSLQGGGQSSGNQGGYDQSPQQAPSSDFDTDSIPF